MLVAAGADVTVATNKGVSSVLIAALGGKVECLRVLVDAGADGNRERPWAG